MKVLVCIPCLQTGGTEIQTLNLVNALVEGGHEVTTVCYFEFSYDMVVRYERAGGNVMLLSTDGTRPAGVKSTLVHLYKGLKRVTKDFRPDVVHVQYMAPGAIPIVLLRLIGVKKILVTVHTNSDVYPNLQFIHFLQRHVVKVWTCITRRAEEGFFGNSALYDKEIKLGNHNHFTIYNSLPRGMRFSGRQKANTPEVVGVVSRLEPIKGMDMVIPAFAIIKRKQSNVKLMVVGDGSLKGVMQRQAEEMGVADAIEWAGRQPQELLHEWYGRMDIVLMPSRSEGFGLTAIEAMSNGCVVVASDTGGLPEVVKDGEVGLLHKVVDVVDMVAKINILFDDNNMYRKMQENVRPYVEKYRFEKFSASFNSLYARL